MRRLPNGAAFHARAGVVRPLEVLRAFLREANVMLDAPVAALQQTGEGWTLRAPDGRALLKADAVVLACGAALTQFEAARFLPIELSRGQIEWGKAAAPAHALTRGNYVAPFDGGVLFGATFDKVAAGEALAIQANADSRTRNLKALAKLSPEIAASVDPVALNSRASFRAATPDRAPIMGALPDEAAWREQNAAVAYGAEPVASPRLPGIYVIGGMGARGLTLAPLLGECIAGEVCGEPALLSREARAAIDPERFLKRAMRRKS